MAIVTTRYIHYDSVARRVGLEAATSLTARTTQATAILANRTVPRRSGALASSQRLRVRQVGLAAHGTIWYPLDYAMSQHEGSRAHVIRPRKPGGQLVFFHKGRLFRVSKVNHPGTKPTPWLYAALLIEAGRRDFRVTPR